MKTQEHLHLAKLFLEWEVFKIKLVEEIKTYFIFSNSFFFYENLTFLRQWRKIRYSQTDYRWQYNAAQKLGICMSYNQSKNTDMHLLYLLVIVIARQICVSEIALMYPFYIHCLFS